MGEAIGGKAILGEVKSGEAFLGKADGDFRIWESGDGASGGVKLGQRVSNENFKLGFRDCLVSGASDVGDFRKNEEGASYSTFAWREDSSSGFVSKGEVFSLYVGNIPPSMELLRLKGRFSFFGAVVDVFISRRRSRVDGSKFGFVRFRSRADAFRACVALDGMLCDGFRLQVNEARYARLKCASKSGLAEEGTGNVKAESRSISNSYLGFSGYGSSAHAVRSEDLAKVVQPCATIAREADGHLAAITSKESGNQFRFDFAVVFNSGQSTAGSGGANVEGVGSGESRAVYAENGDHMMAVCFNRRWVGVVPERRFCDSVLLADSLVQGSRDRVFSEVKLGLVSDLAPDCLPGCQSALADTVESNSSASVISGCPKEEIAISSDVVRAFEGLACDKIGAQSDPVSDCVPFSSPDKGGEQIIICTGEESKDQGASVVEEASLSAEEKAEITEQVRFIIHDALRIGKAMGINITPRDARMIKRFAVFRHFDRVKWKMGFDDKEDELI